MIVNPNQFNVRITPRGYSLGIGDTRCFFYNPLHDSLPLLLRAIIMNAHYFDEPFTGSYHGGKRNIYPIKYALCTVIPSGHLERLISDRNVLGTLFMKQAIWRWLRDECAHCPSSMKTVVPAIKHSLKIFGVVATYQSFLEYQYEY